MSIYWEIPGLRFFLYTLYSVSPKKYPYNNRIIAIEGTVYRVSQKIRKLLK
jgi:hypothetical protein